MQSPRLDINKVLKCGDVWPKPNVSVAPLHPLPHFGIQNKYGFWMYVSVYHNNTIGYIVFQLPLAVYATTLLCISPQGNGLLCRKKAEMFITRYSRSVRCATSPIRDADRHPPNAAERDAYFTSVNLSVK